MKKQMDKSLRILWIIIGLFLIVLAGKIIVTPLLFYLHYLRLEYHSFSI